MLTIMTCNFILFTFSSSVELNLTSLACSYSLLIHNIQKFYCLLVTLLPQFVVSKHKQVVVYCDKHLDLPATNYNKATPTTVATGS